MKQGTSYRVMAIDDQVFWIDNLWRLTKNSDQHELIPVVPFESLEKTWQQIEQHQPDIILVGYGLGEPGISGKDVIQFLRGKKCSGRIIANSGGGVRLFQNAGTAVDGSVDKNPNKLAKLLDPEHTENHINDNDDTPEEKEKREKRRARVDMYQELIKTGEIDRAIELLDETDVIWLCCHNCSMLIVLNTRHHPITPTHSV